MSFFGLVIDARKQRLGPGHLLLVRHKKKKNRRIRLPLGVGISFEVGFIRISTLRNSKVISGKWFARICSDVPLICHTEYLWEQAVPAVSISEQCCAAACVLAAVAAKQPT